MADTLSTEDPADRAAALEAAVRNMIEELRLFESNTSQDRPWAERCRKMLEQEL